MQMDREKQNEGEGKRPGIPSFARSDAGSPTQVSSWAEKMSFGKLRPQIFLAIICLSILAIVGIYKGYSEIATATIGGIIALGMKVLENE